MTVGELVEEEWQEYVAQNDMILLAGATVPAYNAMELIRSLGIWDAEVVECVMRDSEGHEDWEVVPNEGTWLGRGYLYKQVVRVIVLKGAEDGTS